MSGPDLARAAAAIEDFLAALGHPVTSHAELRETGRRVAEAFHEELLSGYRDDPARILADTCETSSRGLVIMTGLGVTTLCPHHLLPATGVAHVFYLPGDRVVGLGSLDRLVQCLARRMVLQEELGQQIADALVGHLGAKAAGCCLELVPSCVAARGARQTRARSVTVAFAGDADAELRSTFLARLSVPV